MELCATCIHWRRWSKHPEIEEQNLWGDCKRLNKAEDHITIEGGADKRSTAETREDFGCILHEQVF